MTRLPAAERREQLLETAVDLFARRGYAGATTAELARAAGVTEPILYRHFASKKDLFIAVIERAGAQTIETWSEALATAKDPPQRLRRLVGANPMILGFGRGAYRVVVQALTEIEDEDILEALRRHVAGLHAFVAGEVRLAQEAGYVSRAFSPEITAWTLLHLGLGYGMLAPLGLPHHATDDKMSVRQVILRLMLGDHAKQVQDGWAAKAEQRERDGRDGG
jgi:AcrR family transcriptional regulator